MRSLRLAAVRLILASLAALLVFSPAAPLQADSAPPPDEPHAAVLSGFLNAWQSGDIDRVMAHFSPAAAISWASDWSHAGPGGPIHVRTWLQAFLRERGTLTGRLERADGAHASWRLSRRLTTDIQLGLPAQDSIVEVELRDGRIITLAQHADPSTRERYSRAIQTLSNHHPALASTPHVVPAIPPRTTTPSPTLWIAATAACFTIALCTAFARRTRP